ncbi:hypothetical protein QBC44DRAFT_376318 [Cladorrhinum sp. PSN332]|nr:hypothetical protein QBC44DRAFT_376318 [Cladorrhinum sp. PSN332]
MAELTLAVILAIDLCINRGNDLVGKYKAFRNADARLEELSVRAELCWERVKSQIDVTKELVFPNPQPLIHQRQTRRAPTKAAFHEWLPKAREKEKVVPGDLSGVSTPYSSPYSSNNSSRRASFDVTGMTTRESVITGLADLQIVDKSIPVACRPHGTITRAVPTPGEGKSPSKGSLNGGPSPSESDERYSAPDLEAETLFTDAVAPKYEEYEGFEDIYQEADAFVPSSTEESYGYRDRFVGELHVPTSQTPRTQTPFQDAMSRRFLSLIIIITVQVFKIYWSEPVGDTDLGTCGALILSHPSDIAGLDTPDRSTVITRHRPA